MEKNIENNQNQARFLFKIVICFSLLSAIFLAMNIYSTSFAAEGSNEKKFCYLSDISAKSAVVGDKTLLLDKNYNGKLITVSVNGEDKTFFKGVFAHAASEVVYDLSNYQYDYFTAYIGFDIANRANPSGDGAKFKIYTSQDEENWTEILNDNTTYTLATDAKFVKLDVKNAKYLKLKTESGRNPWSDHTVYANAKLIKEDYVESENTKVDYIKTIEEYDQIIKSHKGEEITGDYELALLQREFVKNFGYDYLQFLLSYDGEFKETVQWLLNDVNNLRPYILGGKPEGGSYLNSIKVLQRLYKERGEDLKDTTEITTTRGKKTLGDMYKTMMLALSLTHSGTVRFWSDSTDRSDPVRRYDIYKELYHGVVEADDRTTKGIGDPLIQKDKFASLAVEEMRWVMNTIIDDDSIKWLNWFAREVKNGAVGPYSYQRYTFGYNYAKDDYYSEESRAKWTEKYNLAPANGKWNVPYGLQNGMKKTKMWIVFEEGSVCGGLSKNGAGVWGAYMGLPNTCVSQPAHCAYIFYNQDANGNGIWGLGNDVGGWHQSGRTEHLNVRMPLEWGNQEYIDFNKDWLGMGTYVLLSQGALNQFDNFKKSRETQMLTDVYNDDLNDLEQIYRKSLDELPINIDAWYGLIKTYRKDETKTDADYYELATGIFEKLKYYPLPMYHLAREVQKNLTTPTYQFKFTIDQTKALNEGKAATANETLQVAAVRQESTYLSGQIDSTLAKFSFDGENANSIVLGSRFDGSDVAWDYSLDGKKTWSKTPIYTKAGEHKYKLSAQEIASITAENDIYVHIMGVDYSEDNVYKIDIKEQSLPANLYANDLENRIIGTNDGTEWRYTDRDDWTRYTEVSPDLIGNKTIQIRQVATGTSLTSPVSEFYTFTEDKQPDTRKYIPVSYLTKVAVSTEAVNNGGAATNALDANYNTRYHSAWNGTDTDRFLVVKLETPVHLSAVEFVPAGGGNGRIVKGEILGSATGEDGTWVSLVNNNDAPWSWPAQANDAVAAKAQTKSFEIPEEKRNDAVQYVKIVATQTNGNWFAARAFNFYEDLTKLDRTTPTAAIEYSTTEKTNEPVIAKLVNPSAEITITNNNGNDSYAFTENGEFIFEFEDKNGNKGTEKAKVTWIDKVAPEVNVSYKLTGDKKLLAVLDSISEDAYLLNENNKKTNYVDVANGKIISIDYLDENEKMYKTIELNEDRSTKKISYVNNDTSISNVAVYTVIPNGVDENQIEQFIEEYYDIDGNKLADADISESDKTKLRQLRGNARSNPLEFYIENNREFEFKLQDKAKNIVYKNVRADYIQENTKILASEITYSTMNITNQDVTVTIKTYVVGENSKQPAKLINNDGNDTYTFTNNGEFTFEYADPGENLENPNRESKRHKAAVNWIDRTAPTAEIKYSTRENADKIVVTLVNESEAIRIINNGGKREYTFTDNGEFTFEFEDIAGNKGTETAKVDWIEEKQEDSNNYISGDANKDGKITATDLLLIKRHLVAGEKQENILTGERFLAGDINKDGKITATDLLLIKRLLVKQMEIQ